MRRLFPIPLVLAAGLAGLAPGPAGGHPVRDPGRVLRVPDRPRPAYLVPGSDPVFGTRLVRIAGDTGAAIGAVPGRWGADARHAYSKQQPWNADGSLLLLQNRDGGTPARLLLDGRTYRPLRAACPESELYDYRWHPKRASLLINVDKAGGELSWIDVGSCAKVRSWRLPVRADDIGSGEGNPSNDGRFVALGNGRQMFVVDMDPQPPHPPWPHRRIGPVYELLPCGLDPGDPDGDCRIGNLSISPSGRFIDVKFSGKSALTQDVHRIFEVDPATLAIRPRTMAAASLRCGPFASRRDGWIFPLKHADMALDPSDGNADVLVGGRSCPGSTIGRVVKVRLSDGKVTALSDPRKEASVSHVSTRNLARPGWAYVGYFAGDGRRFSDEIVAVSLDGRGTVERLAHKHAATRGCYRCESHPVPSPDGRRVLFASNWAEDCASPCGERDDIKAYVLETSAAPRGGASPPPRRR
jgi:hypothetical protein